MTGYEKLLEKAHRKGLYVKEVDFTHVKGLLNGRKIGIRRSIETSAEKADVLAEEIAHYDLTVGNILDQSVTENRKQEHEARCRAHDMRIGLDGIIQIWEMGCRNSYEAAECLGTSQEFFEEAMEYYRQKYGTGIQHGDYTIVFEPSLIVIKDVNGGELWKD